MKQLEEMPGQVGGETFCGGLGSPSLDVHGRSPPRAGWVEKRKEEKVWREALVGCNCMTVSKAAAQATPSSSEAPGPPLPSAVDETA